ncbi:MAG: ThuA domain-containing protein [Lentisphaeraceae bacterium]|nr:ThuA domain-containing protein [Lentisphaeraceae bacterium]
MKYIILISFILCSCQSTPPEKIKVLMLNGLSTHNWQATTKDTKDALLQTGRFTVDISTSPKKKASQQEWSKWLPDFSKYDVVVSHINDQGKAKWSEKLRAELSEYVKNGGGFVVVHSANNSSYDWPDYNRMIAVGGWGGRKAGVSGFLLRNTGEKWQGCCENEGLSGGHGPEREFLVTVDEPTHPVMKGLPREWLHSKDELYHSLRGPAEEVEVLASSYCSETKVHEPMAMMIKFGKGTVFHTPMGHYNEVSTKCLGFQTVFVRGTEYAATGNVTIGLPKDFPTKHKSAHKTPNLVEWSK